MKHMRLQGHDAALNLALEETLLDLLHPGEEGWFLLWQNSPCVVIGKHQQAEAEVDKNWLQAKDVPLYRRNTGGGAVYHDPGNLNFSFMEYVDEPLRVSFADYSAQICLALKSLGVEATPGGRNDIEVKGKKISGSAQLRRDGKVLHHGTLLYDLDLERLAALLTPESAKLSRHAVASVSARVANLHELFPGLALGELESALLAQCAPVAGQLQPEVLARAETLAREKYRCVRWNWGQPSPSAHQWIHAFEQGRLVVNLETKGNRILDCRFEGDFFALQDVETLRERLRGVALNGHALSAICSEPWIQGCPPETLQKVILDAADG